MEKRAIWKGNITFGLVSIPVSLFSAEKSNDLHFRLIDNRNLSSIHYERINDETGKEVPWDAVAKGYEYSEGNYVLLDKNEIEKIAGENLKIIDIEDFVSADDLESIYYAKPYYLVPGKGGEKGYVLLREILKENHKVGIATAIIRTRQHIAALMPYDDALILNLLRYPNELIKKEELKLPTGELKKYKVSHKEIEMANQLIDNMTVKWKPQRYHDKYREAVMKWIKGKIHKKKAPLITMEGHKPPKETKVIDFMGLLKKSLQEKKKKSAFHVKPSAKKHAIRKKQ
jgi:DNA end-binding protein Ku